jgi:hypothetical protein
MTLFSMRAACTLLLATSLAACGGGSDKAKFPVSGTVSGLYYGTLTLKTGTQTVDIKPTGVTTAGVANVVNYSFPTILEYGDVYYVQLGTNPEHQSCTVNQFEADSAGHTASINIAVGCTVNAYTVNGYIYNLKGAGLQLINGSLSGTLAPTVASVDAAAVAEAAAKAAAAAATPPSTSYTLTPSFSFATAVTYNQAYGVTILTQPDKQTCTVTNGSGLMGDAPVVNVFVNCVDNPT